ncbi:hypothetical protein [Deinococcus peraridilitoris]|uniref:PEGA domain-containing protein n=1 Tax=Deinococcus peraridilitoris (strain DSM 19664 / LMG 22246 / CIP 109416 / KR-200) TaxID=937777 RepID=L0A3X2_DEIPD|nr:hypothetical protein [Deinococcus peraridilitoris]AFZ68109.1 hypothetical protein Deipe_2644 [Deinococcus peraridilitoris DSM 19664]
MRYSNLTLLGMLALLLPSCTLAIQPRPYNVTVDNSRCFTTATVFIDGQNVGTVPGGGLRSFPVTSGIHEINVDNDLIGSRSIRVQGDLTWRGGTCL